MDSAPPATVTLDDVDAAARRLDGVLRRTPTIRIALDDGRPLTLKLEQLQVTGSFKARGATNAIRALPADTPGVVTASGGNHGQAVAWAATNAGIDAVVVVPTTSPDLKADRVASFTCISGASFDLVGRRLRRDLAPGAAWPGRLFEVLGQLRRSWYMVLFQLPVVPEQAFARGVGARVVERFERLEPRDGHPADTLAADGANGVNLYRANLHRVLRPRRGRVHVPVRVVVGDRDPALSAHLFEDLDAHADDAAVEVVRGAHWLPRTHPEVVADRIRDLVEHVVARRTAPA